MINNWIGRVFGWSSSGSGATSLLSGIGISDITAPSTSIVDSDELEAELARARRYEHDLSIVVLSARPLTHGTPPEGVRRSPESRLPQMVALLAAVALREVLRRSDVVCYQPAENRFVLALAESDEGDARQAVGRLRSHFRTRMRLRLRAGIARFPTDAFTLGVRRRFMATVRAKQLLQVSVPTGLGHWRTAGVHVSVWVGSVREQHLHDLALAIIHGDPERQATRRTLFWQIRVRPALEQESCRRDVLPSHGG